MLRKMLIGLGLFIMLVDALAILDSYVRVAPPIPPFVLSVPIGSRTELDVSVRLPNAITIWRQDVPVHTSVRLARLASPLRLGDWLLVANGVVIWVLWAYRRSLDRRLAAEGSP